jgi:coenzyme F420-reducing hydrogenase alpha subunit
LEITKIVGGRAVHPITPIVGGFSKIPEKEKLKEILKKIPKAIEDANLLIGTFRKIDYPVSERETLFASVFSGKDAERPKDYPFYLEKIVKIGNEKFTASDFYSVQIEEDLKSPPVKRVKFKGKPYMLGAIARIKNNENFLEENAKEELLSFRKEREISKEKFFKNIFHNLFSQAIEVSHFLEVSKDLIEEILKFLLKKENPEIKFQPSSPHTKFGVGASGLSALEAPRGTLFHYYEIDKDGRILNCNIITPTAQFLRNLEEDLKIFLPKILKSKKKDQIRKIRFLIRIYDPCISCATH